MYSTSHHSLSHAYTFYKPTSGWAKNVSNYSTHVLVGDRTGFAHADRICSSSSFVKTVSASARSIDRVRCSHTANYKAGVYTCSANQSPITGTSATARMPAISAWCSSISMCGHGGTSCWTPAVLLALPNNYLDLESNFLDLHFMSRELYAERLAWLSRYLIIGSRLLVVVISITRTARVRVRWFDES